MLYKGTKRLFSKICFLCLFHFSFSFFFPLQLSKLLFSSISLCRLKPQVCCGGLCLFHWASSWIFQCLLTKDTLKPQLMLKLFLRIICTESSLQSSLSLTCQMDMGSRGGENAGYHWLSSLESSNLVNGDWIIWFNEYLI